MKPLEIGDPVRDRRGRRGRLVDPGSGAHPLARVAVLWDGSGVVEVVSPRSVWRRDRDCAVCGGPSEDHGILNGYHDKHDFEPRTARQRQGSPLLSASSGMSPDTSTDQEVIGMNVKAENEKIAAAMKGRAAAKPRKVSAKEALQTKPREIPSVEELLAQTDAVLVEAGREDLRLIPGTGIQVDADGNTVGVDEAEVERLESEVRTEEPTEEEDMTVEEITPEAPEAPAVPAKAVTVLEDPIENQNLIRMRAKWAAQRADVVVERLEKAGDAKGVKEAKKVANAAWAQEARELKTLRSMREASKAAKAAVKA